MKKRILSILLTLCMALCLVSTAVFAEATPTGTALTQENISYYKQEKNSTYSENGVYLPTGSYYLAEDIYLVGDDADPNSAWPLFISEDDVTLDLNGHVLDLKKKNICIYSNVNLTLTDSNQNAEHKFRVEDSGLWVLDETQGTETVAGGVITGGTGVEGGSGTIGTLGGGVNVSGGNLTMNGGSIVGCTANSGGGVGVSGGSFTMNGGRITGCTAVKSGNNYGSGGGVRVDENSSFTMAGGSIEGCTAADAGGGVCVSSGSFTMEGGSIVGCTASYGGGVDAGGDSFTMKGGSITDCTATYAGGGVNVAYGRFTMEDGSIKNCNANNGGGIYVQPNSMCELTMNGGSITNCTAAYAGGGVYLSSSGSQRGSFTMEGGSIADCKAGGAPNAVHADGNFTDNSTNKIDKSLVTGIKAGHAGTGADPILIATTAGLEDFRDRVNNGETFLCAKLLCDIVLNDGSFDENGNWSESGTPDEWTPIGEGNRRYCGTFDGGGYTIKGLYVDGSIDSAGLFGIIGSDAAIIDLIVTGFVAAESGGRSGGIVGRQYGGSIMDCINACTVQGDYCGGLAGEQLRGSITGCINTSTVQGKGHGGGIVGVQRGGSITNCYNIGTINGVYCGGIASEQHPDDKRDSASITNCYSIGKLADYGCGILDYQSEGNSSVNNCYYLAGTAKYAVGTWWGTQDNVEDKTKTQFAGGDVLALLKKNDTTGAWGECGYLAAAGMTLPLLSWQTADAHTHDYQWKYDNTKHWKECDCNSIEAGSTAAHKEVTGICTNGIKCACDYEMYSATGGHSYPADWTAVRPGSTHSKACTNPGCGVTKTESCTGGTATCTEQATCEVCGEKYGTTNPNNHSYEWQNENSRYWQKCKLCGFETDKKLIPTITVTGSDKVCRTQDYTFSFTLPEGATDAGCGYGFSLMGGDVSLTVENGVYSGVVKSEWYDENENSFVLTVYAKTADGFEFSAKKTVAIQNEHSGGTATCTEQATCEICGEKYGDLKLHSYSADWVTDETNHWHECTECEAKTDESEHTDTDKNHKCDVCEKILSECADNDKDHKCDLCGKALSEHTGGTATCKDKAVCEVCGESYGELDSNNHADMKHIEVKAATKTDEGNIEYWYCEGCGKYFADKDGAKEITKADTVTAKLPEEKPTSPKTGDTSNLALWIALLFISGGVITVTTVVSKKKRHS